MHPPYPSVLEACQKLLRRLPAVMMVGAIVAAPALACVACGTAASPPPIVQPESSTIAGPSNQTYVVVGESRDHERLAMAGGLLSNCGADRMAIVRVSVSGNQPRFAAFQPGGNFKPVRLPTGINGNGTAESAVTVYVPVGTFVGEFVGFPFGGKQAVVYDQDAPGSADDFSFNNGASARFQQVYFCAPTRPVANPGCHAGQLVIEIGSSFADDPTTGGAAVTETAAYLPGSLQIVAVPSDFAPGVFPLSDMSQGGPGNGPIVTITVKPSEPKKPPQLLVYGQHVTTWEGWIPQLEKFGFPTQGGKHALLLCGNAAPTP